MATIDRDNVYLYSRHNGRIEAYQGRVVPYMRGKGRFVFERCGKVVYLQCPLAPDVVNNKVVWMLEKDDQKAIDLFVEHEVMAIKALYDKIERHEWNIKMIREFA